MMLSKQQKISMFKRAGIFIGLLCLVFLLISAKAPEVKEIKAGLEYVAPEDVGWSSKKLEGAKAFAKILFDGKGGFYHTGVGIHTLAVLPEHRLVYIYRYDTDGEYQDPGEATIQLVSMIMNARLSK